MSDLQEMLSAHNPFVHIYQQATERLQNEENRMRLQNPGYNWRTDGDIRAVVTYRDHTDSRRYNIPSADEIAVILPDIQLEPGAVMLHRDIVIQLRDGTLKKMSEASAAYAPLHYVLLFPQGELGWHWNIPLTVPQENHTLANIANDDDGAEGDLPIQHSGRKQVSQIEYYAYRLFPRVREAKTLLQARKLLQQYIVDGWASAEQERLQWVQLHQKELRAELYHQVRDTFAGLDDNINPQEVGRRVILPATFNGSVRDMMENLQNSLAIS